MPSASSLCSGYKLFDCEPTGVPNAVPMCPPGVALVDCPRIYNCYAPCLPSQNNTWVTFSNGFFGGPVDAVASNGFPYFDGSRYLVGGLCQEYAHGAPNAAMLVDLGVSFLPQGHFENIYVAILTIFRILTFDNWTTVLFSCIRATDPAYVLYFVLMICVGNYIILNLFLAILLDNFQRHQRAMERQRRKERKLNKDEPKKPQGLLSTMASAAATGTKRISGRFAATKLGSFIQSEVLAPAEEPAKDRKRSTHSRVGGSIRQGSMRNTSFMQSSMQMTSTHNLNAVLDSINGGGDGGNAERSKHRGGRSHPSVDGGGEDGAARPKPRTSMRKGGGSRRMSEAFLENLVSGTADAQATPTNAGAGAGAAANQAGNGNGAARPAPRASASHLQRVASRQRHSMSRASVGSIDDSAHPGAPVQSNSRHSVGGAGPGPAPAPPAGAPVSSPSLGPRKPSRANLVGDDRMSIQEEIKNIVRRESASRGFGAAAATPPPQQHQQEQGAASLSYYPSMDYIPKEDLPSNTSKGNGNGNGRLRGNESAYSPSQSTDLDVPTPAFGSSRGQKPNPGSASSSELVLPGKLPVAEAVAGAAPLGGARRESWREESSCGSSEAGEEAVWPEEGVFDGYDSDPGPSGWALYEASFRCAAAAAGPGPVSEAAEGAPRLLAGARSLGRGAGPVAEGFGFGSRASSEQQPRPRGESDDGELNQELLAWGTKKSGAAATGKNGGTKDGDGESDAGTGTMTGATQPVVGIVAQKSVGIAKQASGTNWASPGRSSHVPVHKSRSRLLSASSGSRRVLTKTARKPACELTGPDERAEQAYQFLVERLDNTNGAPTTTVTGRVAGIVTKIGTSFIQNSIRGAVAGVAGSFRQTSFRQTSFRNTNQYGGPSAARLASRKDALHRTASGRSASRVQMVATEMPVFSAQPHHLLP